MKRDKIVEEVLDVFEKYSECARADLLTAESLEELVDSMARIEIVFEIEDKYGIELSDQEVLAIRKFSDVVDGVERHLLTNVA